MAKRTVDTEERFIELRAQGWTFSRIAEDLGVSRQTLINWSKDLEEELASRRALELELLADKYYLSREKRLELFGEKLEAVKQELDRRIEDGALEDPGMTTAKLFDLLTRLHGLIETGTPAPGPLSEKEMKGKKQEREMLEGLLSFT